MKNYKKNVLNEVLRNDRTNLFNKEYTQTYSGNIEEVKPGNCFFASPYLSYGDYDNSCNVERSNVRVFLEQFKGHKDIIHKTGAYSSECILIDILCEDEEIIEILNSLENYPALNDEDCNRVVMEIEEESWSNWIEGDFLEAILKKYKADDSDIKNDKDLKNLYYKLKEEANEEFIVESGGNGYIDIKKLINALPDSPPQFLNLEYWNI